MSLHQSTSLFRDLVARRVQNSRDVDGRPVGEQRAEGYESVETELVKCPYSGSRRLHPNPMNVSAMRQINAEWDEILEILRSLNAAYCRILGRPMQTDLDLYFVSGLGVHVLDFLCYHKGAARDAIIPRSLAAVYKVCLGFQFALFQRSFDADLASRDCRFVDPDSFYEQIDKRKRLIGASQVCAGPENMIKEAYQMLIDQKPAAPARIPGIDASIDRIAAFGFRFSRYWYNSLMFLIARAHLVHRLNPLIAGSPAEPRWNEFHERARSNAKSYIFEDLEEFVDALASTDGTGRLRWLTDDPEAPGWFSDSLGNTGPDLNSLLHSVHQLEATAKNHLAADLVPAMELLGLNGGDWKWDEENWRYWSLWTSNDLSHIVGEPRTTQTAYG